jgi:hypothetical protein
MSARRRSRRRLTPHDYADAETLLGAAIAILRTLEGHPPLHQVAPQLRLAVAILHPVSGTLRDQARALAGPPPLVAARPEETP